MRSVKDRALLLEDFLQFGNVCFQLARRNSLAGADARRNARSLSGHYCNLQNIGNDRVISFENNKKVNEQMKALGLTVITPHLEEILKGGGGPHCMTMPLERGVECE